MVNAGKTQCMFIGSRQLLSQVSPNIKTQVDGNFIIPCKSVKNLPTHFDNFMLLDTHITEMSKKIYRIIMYITRIRDNINKNTRIAVIQSLVLTVINYGIKGCLRENNCKSKTKDAKTPKLCRQSCVRRGNQMRARYSIFEKVCE